jgi:putative ABC transport system permease protein
MKLGQALKMAIKSISSGKMRSLLTMLGVIIGIASVMVMVSYAKGQNMAIQEYYKSLGSNRINVYATHCDQRRTFEIYNILQQYCLKERGTIAAFAPNVQISGLNIQYGIKLLQEDNHETYPTIYLSNEQFSRCNNYKLARGREFQPFEIDQYSQVCVLGAATAKELFGFANPIHQKIQIGGVPFLVIGVYEPKAVNVGGKKEEQESIKEALEAQDRLVLLPYSMTRILNKNQPIQEFIVKAQNADTLPKAFSRLTAFLRNYAEQNGGSSDVSSSESFIKQDDEANKLQQRFLGGIAAISLLVGGIGIMNIMLVTVKERTREIGVRKAIGAERKSIITQFLIEAAVLCGVGGILGIVVGCVGTLILGKMTFNTVLLPDTSITVGSFVVSLLLGLIFGMYPAAKASRLPPVEALRAD